MFPYGGYGSPISMLNKMAAVTGVCLFLAIIAGFFLFFWFLSKKNEKKFTGFWGWMYEFLSFKKMLAESILRVTYLILASFITLLSFGYLLFTEGGSIGERLILFLEILVIGNAAVRVAYEFLLITLIICRNTTEINNKMGNTGVFSAVAPPVIPAAPPVVPAAPPVIPAAPPVIPAAPPVVPVAPPVVPVAPPVVPVAPPVVPAAPPVDPVPQIVFCYGCGNKINANDTKCPHCGAVQ